MDNQPPAVVEPRRQEVMGPVKRPGSLSTIKKVRQEIARVYRDARTHKISMTELGKLAYCLNILAKVAESEAYENRLKAIEATLEIKN